MKKIFFILSVVTFTTFVVSCNNTNNTETKVKTGKIVYTCPMHPDVKSDKPGKCPKCGDMDLEKTEE